jgi:selT/selW/selH-like putative selenoprotein
LKQDLGTDCTLTASGGGVFEVRVDGKLIFSKQSLGRFPEDGEVLGLIQAR